MALTRRMLEALGIEEKQLEQIIEAHAETVDALKKERDRYKADAERLPGVEEELETLRAQGDDGYKEKFEAEKKAFEDFKKSIEAEKANAEKSGLYREMLKGLGVDESRIDAILRVTDLSSIEVKDGKIEGIEDLQKSAKEEWKSFITEERETGAGVDNPPDNGGKEDTDLGSMSMEDYIKARKGQ